MRPLRRRAFSLIELVICVAIIATVAGVASVRFARSSERARVDAAAKRIALMVDDARTRARSGSSMCRILIDTASSTMTLKWLPTQNAEMDVIELGKAPYRVRLKSSAFVSDRIDFSARGRPSMGGTIDVGSGAFARRISIDPETGHATIQ